MREKCSESLGYICLSISGVALLPEHEDVRIAISDSSSGEMIRNTLHSEVSARCGHHVHICLSAFEIREASLSEYSSMLIVYVKSGTLRWDHISTAASGPKQTKAVNTEPKSPGTPIWFILSYSGRRLNLPSVATQ